MSVPANGRIIFTSGLVSRDSLTGEVAHAGDIRAQTRLACENLRRVLAEGGATMDDVVKLTVFIPRRTDYAAMVEERCQFFAEPRPACSSIIADLADERLLVEIEAVAVVPEGR
jgi:2-iminobutanoate/2-iminopropanoate deaminase